MNNNIKKKNSAVEFSMIDLNNNFNKPPQLIEIEADILGIIMTEPNSFDIVDSILITSECFYDFRHKTIYEAMFDVSRKFDLCDITSVVQNLSQKGLLETIGGARFVSQLTNRVRTGILYLERDCLLLREKYMRRSLIAMGASFIKMGYDETEDTLDIIDYAENKFNDIVNNLDNNISKTASVVAAKVIIETESLMNKEISFTGIQSGYPTLDKVTCGWQPTDLIIIAARPSVGKTAFALNLAGMSAKLNNKVGFFSLEMSNAQLVKRLLSTFSKIDLNKINRGRLEQMEFEELLSVSGLKQFENILLDDSASLNIFEFRSKARKMVKHGCKMIIVDYLQLMSGTGKENNREQEISTISRGIKKTAKELNIPIILLSQLSRDIEKRERNEPKLSDLRESGAIEQDADIVAFLTREDYQQTNINENSNKGWLKIKKHRNGSLADIPFITNFSTQQWTEDIPVWKSSNTYFQVSSQDVKELNDENPF